ncbi:MAG TPA: tyrosine-protein phosphatase [Blastocatellia bacterium]|nr:tyrosine-protein phosphatase [Blastocatellia bacterium]
MNRHLFSTLFSTARPLFSFILIAASQLTPAPAAHGSVVSATVTRVGAAFQISWTTTGDVSSVKIKEGVSPGHIENLVAKVSGITSTTVTGLDPNLRHYFHVKGGSGDGVIAAERDAPQVGALNFRDIGGYSTMPNSGGHTKNVRWGLFFRSGGPNAQSNQSFLTTLGVKTVVDVRAPNEITAAAPQWNVFGAHVISSPIFDQGAGAIPDPVTPRLCLPQNVSLSDPMHHYFAFDPVCFADQDAFFGPNGEFFTQFKNTAFRAFVSGAGPPGVNFGSTVPTALRTMMLALTNADNLPLVWADSGGAARAGWGAAVVLMALGVTEDEVMQDYLLTNQFRGSVNNAQLNALIGSGRLGKSVYLEPQLFERPEYLQAALDEMHQLFGTFENYVHQALGITDEQLDQIRANLLKG